MYIYIAAVLAYNIAEQLAISRRGGKSSSRDFTVYMIAVPFYLSLVAPVPEYNYLGRTTTAWRACLGLILFLAASFFRVRGHLDLGRAFSMKIETPEGPPPVDTGIYATIRHPLYLGNIFLFPAGASMLASVHSWVFVATGIPGVLARIPVEEKHLLDELDGYEDYKENTWALIPGLY